MDRLETTFELYISLLCGEMGVSHTDHEDFLNNKLWREYSNINMHVSKQTGFHQTKSISLFSNYKSFLQFFFQFS